MGEEHVPSVLGALRMARKALVENHNVLATDRPDLERAPDTGWTTDFRKEIDAIDAAAEMLVGCPGRTAPECGRCSTPQLNAPCKGPARPVEAPQGSRSPQEGRS